MAYARDYRPTTLDEYIGNNTAKNIIHSVMDNRKVQHTVLFHGLTGCGKTTGVRLFMKENECTNRIPGKGACNECETCQLFNEYILTGNTDELPDVKEINVAEMSGKNDVVSILEDRVYEPVDLKYKYYYFDEVHKANDALQNYLLKPLEEPEEHVIFIASTTEVDKLIDTLQNRFVLRIEIKRPTEVDIVNLLGGICSKESVDFDVEALRMIGSRADYVIRDSLNYLQQVVDSTGKCKANDVTDLLGVASDTLMFDFFNAYINQDLMRYMSILHKVRSTMSFANFVTSLRNFVVRGSYILNGVDVEGITPQELKRFKRLFGMFDISQLSYILSSLLQMSGSTAEAQLLNLIYSANQSTVSYNINNALSDENVSKNSKNSTPKGTGNNSKPKLKTSENQIRTEVRKEKEAKAIEESQKALASLQGGKGTILDNLGAFSAEVVAK